MLKSWYLIELLPQFTTKIFMFSPAGALALVRAVRSVVRRDAKVRIFRPRGVSVKARPPAGRNREGES
jgi:hypothetical protein